MAGNDEYQMAHRNDTRVRPMLAAFISCLVIPYIGVGLRFLSRRISNTRLGKDDLLILVSLVTGRHPAGNYVADCAQPFTTCFVAVDLLAVRYGLGHHEVAVADPESMLKVQAIGTSPGRCLTGLCSV